MNISPEQLARVRDLYFDGYYLQAYHFAETIGPLAEWEGTDARLLAGRLANNLGSYSLGRKLHLQAYRNDPQHGEAVYYKARLIHERRGPLAAWNFLCNVGETVNAPTVVQADWLAYHAIVLGALRDFDAAEEWLAKAEKLDPANPWIWIERSHLYELEDKYEESLMAANRSLELRPNFRPGVQAAAQMLVLLGRDAEALQLLTDAAQQIESCWLVGQLAQLQIELGLHAEARQSIERFAELAPLIDKPTEQWLHAQRADIAYLCGDYEAALHFTQLSESLFHKLVAERMQAAGTDAKRVLLPVGFVRQHYLTCAPATLTFISRFWQMPVEHLSVVEAICYDGTPARSERDWAEKQGWFVREFCVNWDDTVKLIDRGIPFTLTTVHPGNAHLQSVIGYDSRRGTMLVRDPYERSLGEFAAKEMLERYASSGPRGMAMVPMAQNHLLEDLNLHEASLYDGLYQVQQALYTHERTKTDALLQAMTSTAENHRLTHQAQLSVAEYDCDDMRVLACLDKLLALFPEDANWRLYKLSVLRRMARRTERLELLQAIYADKRSHPLFWQMYADELGDDGREQAKVRKLLRRTMRYGAGDAHNYFLLANQFWTQNRFAEAKELYRFAACLKDTNEYYVRAYFNAAQYFHEQSEALQFLSSRFQRFGKRSGYPARTLSWAYEQTGQQPRALEVLREGLRLRPDDAELMLYAVDVLARFGKFDEAARWLQQAESKARREDWLHTAATVAAYRGELTSALSTWQSVLQAEPLSIGATRNIAQLLADTQGDEAVLSFLRERIAQFPHNLALHRLLVEWARNDSAAQEQAARAMIEVDPVDAWAHRELAQALISQQRYQAALAEAELAQKLEPTSPYSYNLLARVYTETGKPEEAKAAYRETIKLSVDNDFAIASLIAISHSATERRAALQFIKEELVRQVTFGDGLLAYREYARSTLSDEELRDVLQAALQARPDLWPAWSALCLHLVDMQQYDEALKLAEQSAEFFPLVPRVWFDLSLVHQSRLDRQGEIAALQKALEINPSWGKAVRQLADAYLNSGELEKARTMLEQSIAQTPLDSINYGYLADVLWRLGEKEQAIEQLKRAVTIEPGYDWAWTSLRAWSKDLKRENEVIALARELAEKRSGEARSWLLLAQTLDRSEDLPERLRALDRANDLNPRLVEAHVMRARLLSEAHRYDAARAACHPAIFNGDRPARLRTAEALVEADSGNLEQAIEKMYEVVNEEPNNYEGWDCLVVWTRGDERRKDQYLKAATELARIAPNYVISLGYLGEARSLNGDRAGAKEAFKRAFTLSPDYDFGGFNLFDLQLEDDEIEAAKETLQTLKQHVGGDWVTLRELDLAIKQKDKETATKLFRHLCQETEAERSLLDFAIKAMDANNLYQQAEMVLEESLDVANANPAVGDIWVERWVERGEFEKCRQRLEGDMPRSPVWHHAAGTFLEKSAKTKRVSDVRKFVQKNAAALRSDNDTWGTVGYVLLELDRYKDVVEWLADWRTRKELRPWMFWNYVLALRHLNRDTEAYEAGRHAVELPPDHIFDAHQVLLSFDEVLANDVETAGERLRQIHYDGLRDWDKFAYDTAVTMVEFARAPEEGVSRLASLAALRRGYPPFWKDKLLFRAHRRATQKIAEQSDNFIVKLWAYLQVGALFLQKAFLPLQG
ncbi:MAG: tetratricopeptide repeat protein [Acidobacteria bacterium]|nr:tetratricopeptide repeat protein [Acidobacteriota bacterium]